VEYWTTSNIHIWTSAIYILSVFFLSTLRPCCRISYLLLHVYTKRVIAWILSLAIHHIALASSCNMIYCSGQYYYYLNIKILKFYENFLKIYIILKFVENFEILYFWVLFFFWNFRNFEILWICWNLESMSLRVQYDVLRGTIFMQ
jgi:hypothetical protein